MATLAIPAFPQSSTKVPISVQIDRLVQNSAALRNKIKVEERIKLQMYRNVLTNGRTDDPTVGVGFNLTRKDSRKALKSVGANFDLIMSKKAELSLEQADMLLDIVLKESIETAKKHIVNFDRLTEFRQIVVVDMIYQHGESKFLKFHRMIHWINIGNFEKATKEMLTNSRGNGPSLYFKNFRNRATRNAIIMKGGV